MQVDTLCAEVADNVVLDNSANLLSLYHRTCSTHAYTDVTTFQQTVLHREVVVVLVFKLASYIGIDEVDVIGVVRLHLCMDIASVYSKMTACVLHM